jgi:hypothetical protein
MLVGFASITVLTGVGGDIRDNMIGAWRASRRRAQHAQPQL